MSTDISFPKIIPGTDNADAIIGVRDVFTSAINIKRMILWIHWRAFDKIDWNKFVKSLASQKKSVSLSQRNRAFNIKVTDDVTGALYERNGLYLKDINKSLMDNLNRACGLT